MDQRNAQIAKYTTADGNLLRNGDMQTDTDGDGSPDNWGKQKEGSGMSY